MHKQGRFHCILIYVRKTYAKNAVQFRTVPMNILTLSRPGYFGRYVDPWFEGGGGGVGGKGAHSNFLNTRCIGLKLARNTDWPMIYIIKHYLILNW